MTDTTKLALGNVRDALAGIAAVATLLTEPRAEIDETAVLLMIAQTAADHLLEQLEQRRDS